MNHTNYIHLLQFTTQHLKYYSYARAGTSSVLLKEMRFQKNYILSKFAQISNIALRIHSQVGPKHQQKENIDKKNRVRYL